MVEVQLHGHIAVIGFEVHFCISICVRINTLHYKFDISVTCVGITKADDFKSYYYGLHKK